MKFTMAAMLVLVALAPVQASNADPIAKVFKITFAVAILGMQGDAARVTKDSDAGGFNNGKAEANVVTNLSQPSIAKDGQVILNPSAFNGEHFQVKGYSEFQKKYFCYDVVVGSKVEQMTSGVDASWTNEKCQKEFKREFSLGNIDKSTLSSKAQLFKEGDSLSCPNGKKRSSDLTMILDPQSNDLSMIVEEKQECEYNLLLKGPIKILQPEEKKKITPSSANGKVFYILGKSEAQKACFCYKVEVGKKLYQHTPLVSCSDYSNERCKTEIKDWNTLIGQKPEVKDNGLVQSYSEGKESDGCETDDKKRTSELTLISDRNAEKLTVTVAEHSACAYTVEVSGPLAELVGEN